MPIDPGDLDVLRALGEACAGLGIEWMLIGAVARDLTLEHLASVAAGRATDDVDVAVLVRSWEEFGALKRLLTDRGGFRATPHTHRLLGAVTSRLHGRAIDIVPFGPGVTEEHQLIRWPPDGAIAMSVTGFDEAYKASVELTVDGQLVRVVSVAGLTMLKLIAWGDRRTETTKDAFDFERLLRTYQHVVGVERLYADDLSSVMDECDFDVEFAAAWLLGADIGAVASAPTSATILALLGDRLVEDMPGAGDPRARIDALVRWCRRGLETRST